MGQGLWLSPPALGSIVFCYLGDPRVSCSVACLYLELQWHHSNKMHSKTAKRSPVSSCSVVFSILCWPQKSCALSAVALFSSLGYVLFSRKPLNKPEACDQSWFLYIDNCWVLWRMYLLIWLIWHMWDRDCPALMLVLSCCMHENGGCWTTCTNPIHVECDINLSLKNLRSCLVSKSVLSSNAKPRLLIRCYYSRLLMWKLTYIYNIFGHNLILNLVHFKIVHNSVC